MLIQLNTKKKKKKLVLAARRGLNCFYENVLVFTLGPGIQKIDIQKKNATYAIQFKTLKVVIVNTNRANQTDPLFLFSAGMRWTE